MSERYTVIDSMGHAVGRLIPASEGCGCGPLLVVGVLFLWLVPFLGLIMALLLPKTDPNRRFLIVLAAVLSVLEIIFLCLLCVLPSFTSLLQELFALAIVNMNGTPVNNTILIP